MIENDNSDQAAEDVAEFITKALYQYEPLLIGSLLVINGLGIFRSLLQEADYEEICQKIYSDRERVTKIFK